MPSAIFQPGRRLLSTAAILMILTASAHTAGHFAPNTDPELGKVLTAMETFHIPLGLDMSPSVRDIFSSLSLTMSITFLALAAFIPVLTATPAIPDAILRRVTWINLLWVGAFLGTNLSLRVLPPLICAILIEIVLLAALLVSSRNPSSPARVQ